MDNKLDGIKKQIDEIRQEIYNYMEYPDIFEQEIMEASNRINELINEYMKRMIE